MSSQILTGSLLAALPIALLAGFVSFASPCVLPLVPGYLGYVAGMTGVTGATTPEGGTSSSPPRSRVVAGVGLFIAGFTAIFVTYGVAAGSIGAALVRVENTVVRVMGVVVIMLGIVFLGGFRWLQRERRFHLRPGATVAAAFPLGAAFAFGWTPCIGPTLAAVLTLGLDSGSAARGAILAIAYCVGLGLPFVLLALAWRRSSAMLGVLRRHRLLIMRIGGAVLIAVGLAMVSGLWQYWTHALQGLLQGFEVAL